MQQVVKLIYIISIVQVEGMSGMCVYVTSHYRTEVVLYTFGLAAAICLVISLLAIFGPVGIKDSN